MAAERRKRRRREADAARHALAVECLAANLCAADLAAPGWPITVHVHPRASARSTVFGLGFNAALRAAEDCGFLELQRSGVYSTARATGALLNLLGVREWSRLSLAAPAAPLVLRGPKDAHGRAPVLDFELTPELRRMAGEVETLSAWFASLAVSREGAQGWTAATRDGTRLRLTTSMHSACVRIFNNGTFAHGGRLYHSWWLALSKAERFADVRIAGEPVAECDFVSMYVRLAYRAVGLSWPFSDADDPYLCGPYSTALERSGLKACTLALLNGVRGSQFPNNVAPNFPDGAKPSQVYSAIREKHGALAARGAFRGTLGHELARTESDFMVELLLTLRDLEIPALPIHDALLVPRSRAARVAALMEELVQRSLGCALPVKILADAPGP